MNISRKEFFRKSLKSLGEAVCKVSDTLRGSAEVHMDLPDVAIFVPTPHADQFAVAHSEHCLAKNSECFACVKRCNANAIRLIPRVGIRINSHLCNGCGTCEYICPVTPKAVKMQSRTAPQLMP